MRTKTAIDLNHNPTRKYQRSNTAWVQNAAAHMLDNEPWFTWWDVPRMVRDPQVRFGLRMLISPFQQIEWKVQADSQRVKLFVDRTLRKFWQSSLPRLLKNYFKYGRAPGGNEFYYCKHSKLWKLARVRPIDPSDANARVFKDGPRTGQLAGFDLPTVGGTETALRPYAFWFAGSEELCAHHDWPRLAGAFTPWLEKNGKGGARHSRRLWYWRHAFSGGTIRHPNEFLKLPDGTSVHSEDIARQLGENFLNGSMLTVPNTPHPSDKMAGKYAWEFEQAESRNDTAGMRDYPKDLDEEIMLGMEIPTEIWKAGGTGSGYAGRAIPMESWLGGADDLAGTILDEFRNTLDTLVAVNFGGKQYDIELVSLVKQFREQGQGQQPGGGGLPASGGDDDGGGSPRGGGMVPMRGPRGGNYLLNPATGTRRSVSLSANGGDAFRKSTRKLAAELTGLSPRERRIRRAAMLAMLQIQEEAVREGKSPDDPDVQAQLETLGELADDPDELEQVLSKSINLAWQEYGTSRSGKKRWKDDQTGKLRYQNTKPGEHTEKRQAAQANAKRGSQIVSLALAGQATAGNLRELADHLPAMTADQLRSARVRLGASFNNATKRDAMVSAMVSHVRGLAEEKANEPNQPVEEKAKAEAKPKENRSRSVATREDGMPKEPKREDVYTVDPSKLKTDPKRFQYKITGVGADGVTNELKSTKQWNPELGGVVLVWRDPSNGGDFVINGHHRHELARRTGAERINVRYIDAPDAIKARSIGALANIAEGRGSATDAAKFLRDTGTTTEDLQDYGVSLSGKVAQDATILKDLSPKAFSALAEGRIEEPKAVAVAKHLKEPELQDKLFKKLEQREDDGKDWSNREIETAAKKLARAGKVTQTETNLFGTFEDEKSTWEQEVELESFIGSALSRTVNDFTAVSNTGRAERVKDAGNTLAIDENKRRRDQAVEHAATFDRESGLKSPVSEAIRNSAADLANAKSKKERDAIKQRTLETVRGILAGPTTDRGGQGTSAKSDAGTAATDAGTPAADRPDSGAAGTTASEEDEFRTRGVIETQDLFGGTIRTRAKPKSGTQTTIGDAHREVWTEKAKEHAEENGLGKIEQWDAGGRFRVGEQWYQVGKAEDGYPITKTDQRGNPQPAPTFKDVTPSGYGPSNQNTPKTVEQRMSGESFDQAAARKVGYQIDNGRVKMKETPDGWQATVNTGNGMRVFTGQKKQGVINQVFDELHPDVDLIMSKSDAEAAFKSGSLSERDRDTYGKAYPDLAAKYGKAPAPSTPQSEQQAPAAKPAPSHDNLRAAIHEAFHDLNANKRGGMGNVRLADIRREVAKQVGPHSREQFDQAAASLRQDRTLNLYASSFGLSPEELADGVNTGVGQSHLADVGTAYKPPVVKQSRGPSAAEVQPHIEKAVQDLLASNPKYQQMGIVPIHEVRKLVKERHGEDAGRAENFNEAVLNLRRAGSHKTTSITEKGRATPEQLAASVPNAGETMFYIEPNTSTAPAAPVPAAPAPAKKKRGGKK
jgi:hypothetical protein